MIKNQQVLSRRHWIPPGAIVFGFVSIGLAWALLYSLSRKQLAGQDIPLPGGLGFIHLAGLAGITMIAMGISFHVLPAFSGIRWRWENLARWSLVPVGLGAWTMVLGFVSGKSAILSVGVPLAGTGLLIWLGIFFLSIYSHSKDHPLPETVWILMGPVFFLAATGALGILMGEAITGNPIFPGTLDHIPSVHAMFALFGWLTFLVVGVSSRTIMPIAGARSLHPSLRIATSILLASGLVLFSGGVLGSSTQAYETGTIFILAGILIYIADLGPLLLEARNPHRIPQLFLASSLGYLLGACIVGGGIVLENRPWKEALVFLMLMGWLTQAVVAHLHHIGIRLIATIVRGDLDQTAPALILKHTFSTTSFFLLQGALLSGSIGFLMKDPETLKIGALMGIAAWLTIAANIRHAWISARGPVDRSPEPGVADPPR